MSNHLISLELSLIIDSLMMPALYATHLSCTCPLKCDTLFSQNCLQNTRKHKTLGFMSVCRWRYWKPDVMFTPSPPPPPRPITCGHVPIFICSELIINFLRTMWRNCLTSGGILIFIWKYAFGGSPCRPTLRATVETGERILIKIDERIFWKFKKKKNCSNIDEQIPDYRICYLRGLYWVETWESRCYAMLQGCKIALERVYNYYEIWTMQLKTIKGNTKKCIQRKKIFF